MGWYELRELPMNIGKAPFDTEKNEFVLWPDKWIEIMNAANAAETIRLSGSTIEEIKSIYSLMQGSSVGMAVREEKVEGPKCAGCKKELKPNDLVYEYMIEGRKSFTHANVDCWVKRAKEAVREDSRNKAV